MDCVEGVLIGVINRGLCGGCLIGVINRGLCGRYFDRCNQSWIVWKMF